MDGERLGEVLRAWRIKARLSQERLAERSGLSARAIGDLERGKVARPHRESVRLLAEALGLDGDDHAYLMHLAGHTLPTPASVDALADHPASPGPVEPVAPGVGRPAILRQGGQDEERAYAEGKAAVGPVAAPPSARRRRLMAAIVTAAACLATAIAKLCRHRPAKPRHCPPNDPARLALGKTRRRRTL